MKKGIYKECLLVVLSFNNGLDLKKTLEKKKKFFPIDILIYFDGSNDGSTKFIPSNWHKNLSIIKKRKNSGIANSIKKIIQYAFKNNYKYICLIPGNNKNNINASVKFFNKLINKKLDYVQGSRFIKGGSYKNTPIIRIILIKLFSILFSFYFKKNCSDCSEGMRAYRLDILKHKEINIFQKWLKNYELESYLHFKIFQLNMRYGEVAVKKVYKKNRYNFLFNPKGNKYTYIVPFVDWWNIIKPYVYLILKIKK
tara:strand:- start:334 stop:1095 length:762 start_codon:yes stop_codon:yes gene_type:complete